MFIDTRKVPNGTRIDTDVCIIGAGAAGITLARELAGTRVQVCLLESGGLEPDPDTQALYVGQNVGLPYYELDQLRLRFFGGTTNHWNGVCRPLDEADFASRSWVPLSGWPFNKQHLDPFYRRAHVVCELGAYDYDPTSLGITGQARLSLDPTRVETAMVRRSPPTRFGQTYRGILAGAANVDTYLHANAVNLIAAESGRALDHVRVATLGGTKLTVHARQFVLATGAIENARLLLISNTHQKAGLGNGNDLVGRFFMEHFSVPGALLLPAVARSVPPVYLSDSRLRGGDGTGRAYLTLPAQTREKEQLLNIRAFIVPANSLEALRGSSAAIESVFGLLRMLRSGARTAEHLTNVTSNLDEVAIYGYRRLFRPPRFEAYWLYNHVEQAPNRDSRVSLTGERDALGLQRVQLDWRLAELEPRTVNRTARLMAEELGRAGIGRVNVIVPDLETGWPAVYRGLHGNWHQMGTTRMHQDSNLGVVDEHCRVHDMDNLYVAGSSVFPTGGYTNPTLTIVALAIRMADHLKGKFT